MKARTLETRVVMASVTAQVVAILLFSGCLALFLFREGIAELDSELSGVARQFFDQLEAHVGVAGGIENIHELDEWLPASASDELVEVESHGRIHFRSAGLHGEPLPASIPGEPGNFVKIHAVKYRVAAFQVGDVILRAATPAAPFDRRNGLITMIFLGGIPGAIWLAVTISRGSARRALEPVREIAAAASRISPNELRSRVPVPEAEDDIRTLALAINEKLERLEKSFQQAMRFSADASHELKTPLTVLHSELEALFASPTLPDGDRELAAGAFEQAKRLKSILGSLLLLSQADAGRLRLAAEPVDLVKLLAECVEDARIAAELSGTNVLFTHPERAECKVDPTRIRQIFTNLLDNALKYNRPGGRVEVRLEFIAGRWEIWIGNSGPTICAELASRLFDRFFRAEHTATRPGTGLGLSISRELARASGGDLRFVPSEDGLNWFQLAIPANGGPSSR